jgi:DNA invertase Pin-like site-specific DNA recombinase
MEKHAIAYLRVSTAAQAGADRYGLEAQKKQITDYADVHNMSILGIHVEQCSGASTDRPIWSRILSGDTGDSTYQAVLVAKADRVSRDVQYYYYCKYVLHQRGIELISASDAEDFASLGPLAPVLEAMTAAFAAYERTRISERMRSGRLIKAAAGGYSGGGAPYGYRPDGKGNLEEDTDEQRALALIMQLRADGRTFAEICTQLDADGHKPRHAARWAVGSVHRIVRNPYYTGVRRYAGVTA